jgi:5-methylcytosine-specific restriction endonuclease McrA
MPTKPKSANQARVEANRAAYDKRRGTFHQRGYGGKAWEQLRKEVFLRDHYRCQHCKRFVGLTPGDSPHCDHIVAKDAGGADVLTNLRTLCAQCHGVRTREEHRGQRARGGRGG